MLGSSAAMPHGHPPVKRQRPSHAPAPPPPAAATEDNSIVQAARVLAEKFLPVPQIASLLSVSEDRVAAAIGMSNSSASSAPIAGRMLGNSWQTKLDDLLIEDPDFCCPIALVLYSDPVIASDGFTYEKASLETLLRQPTRHGVVSPMTREQLRTEFVAATQKKKESIEFREKRAGELLDFAAEAAFEQ